MVHALPAGRFQRELRLFALACARRVWQLLPPESRAAVESAERHADGLAGIAELRMAVASAAKVAQKHFSGDRSPDARAYAESSAIDAASEWPRTAANVLAATSCAASAVARAVADPESDGEYDKVYAAALAAELATQAGLLRDIISEPPE